MPLKPLDIEDLEAPKELKETDTKVLNIVFPLKKDSVYEDIIETNKPMIILLDILSHWTHAILRL